jgi:hypothetical protein
LPCLPGVLAAYLHAQVSSGDVEAIVAAVRIAHFLTGEVDPSHDALIQAIVATTKERSKTELN